MMNVKRSILPALLIVFLLSCSKDNSTGPDNGADASDPPASPYIFNVLPFGVGEPNRAMGVGIDGGFDNIDGFVIQRKQGGASFTTIANINEHSSSVDWTSEGDIIYIDQDNIGVLRSYTYRAQAYNQDGSSSWSNERAGTSIGPISVSLFRNPISDAYVDELTPDANRGNDTYLLVTNELSYRKISYLKFDYDGVPSYALGISSVSLRLICQNEPPAGTVSVRVEDLAEDWSESTVTWNNRPIGRGILYGPSWVYNNGQPVYFDLKTIFMDWYNGITSNHGVALRTQDNDDDIAVLYSRERTNLKPLLEIVYEW